MNSMFGRKLAGVGGLVIALLGVGLAVAQVLSNEVPFRALVVGIIMLVVGAFLMLVSVAAA